MTIQTLPAPSDSDLNKPGKRDRTDLAKAHPESHSFEVEPRDGTLNDVLGAIRQDMQQLWRHGTQVRVESYRNLLQHHSASDDIWLSLIDLEMELRAERGQRPNLDEYEQRFPMLSEDIRARLEVFDYITQKTSNEKGVGSKAPPVDQTATPRRDLPAIPGYEILDVLGRGGMGLVYKARQIGLNRIVALKVILAGRQGGEDYQRRFLQEAESVAALKHPNIVQIYEIGEYEGKPFFSLEYVNGGTLANHLQSKPQPPEFAAEMVEKLARAVHAAHQQKIVHRDLKPANILIADSSKPETIGDDTRRDPLCDSPNRVPRIVPKIADFGLAKRMDSAQDLTTTGMVAGTPVYMAPEQAAGEREHLGPAADIWALGIILYEMLTGRPPFLSDKPLEVMHMVVWNNPVSPRQLQARIPRDLETICLKCLEKIPKKRYASAEELADDLARHREGRPILARRIGAIEQSWRWCRRNRTVAALLTGIALLLIAGTTVASYFAYRANRLAGAADEKTRDAVAAQQATTEAWLEEERQKNEAQRLKQEAIDREYLRGLELYAADANLALKSWEVGELHRTRQFLTRYTPRNATEKDRRGFEWFYIDQLCNAELATTHLAGKIQAFDLAPDGAHFAFAVQDQVKIHDPLLRRPIRTLKASQGPINAVVYNRRGDRIAAGGDDASIHIWSTADYNVVHKLTGHKKEVRAIAFGPDDKVLVSCSGSSKYPNFPGEVIIWDLEKKVPAHTLRLHKSGVNSVTISHSGKILASAGQDQSIQLHDLSSGKHLRELSHIHGIVEVRFSPDDKTLAAGTNQGLVVIFDVETGQTLREFHGHVHWVDALAFSDDGKLLASSGEEGVIRVWNPSTGELLNKLRGHASHISALKFKPNSSTLISTGDDGKLHYWAATESVERRTLFSKAPNVMHACLVMGGKGLLLGCGTDQCFLVDPVNATTLPLGWKNAKDDYILSLDVLPDGDTIMMNLQNAGITFRSVTGKNLVPTRLQGFRGARAAILAPNGKLLATVQRHQIAQPGDRILIHDLAGDAPPRLIDPGAPACAVAFAPGDDPLVAIATEDKKILILRAATGEQIQMIDERREMMSKLCFSPDGTQLAGGGIRMRVWLWEAATGKEIWCREVHSATVRDIQFSPGGERIVTCGSDRTARVLDHATGRETIALRGHPREIARNFFTPDGAAIITVGRDAQVYRWDATASMTREKSRVFAEACRIANPRPTGKQKAGEPLSLLVDLVNPTEGALSPPGPGIPVEGLGVTVDVERLGADSALPLLLIPDTKRYRVGLCFLEVNGPIPANSSITPRSIGFQTKNWLPGSYRLHLVQRYIRSNELKAIHSLSVEIVLE
jgi:serine/threonine protein kinase/WD40 repeat protein